MSRLLAISLLCLFLAPRASAQHLWIDASQFNQKDICVDIQAAIAALPIVADSPVVTAGIVIDARNFTPPSSGTTSGTLSCSVNPFAIFNDAANPVVLVNQGTGSGTAPTPGYQGGIVLLPGFTIATDVPWLVPQSWSIIGQGGRVTFLVPSGNFPNTLTTSGTVTTSGTSSTNVMGSSGTWSSKIVGSVLFACPSGCTASYQTATEVGIVTNQASPISLYLGSAVTLANNSLYMFQTPLLAWASTTNCPSSCQGALQGNTTGSVIQDIGLDCSELGQGMSAVPGCLPFWDQYGQERSQLKRIRITNFSGLGIGIYTTNAQNGGPFDDIQMASGFGAIAPTTTCVEVGGTGLGGPPPGGQGQPFMRGIRGLTCTGPTTLPAAVGTGVDINTQNFTLANAHFEDFNVGVEIGSLTSARGISVTNVTGGGNAQYDNEIVDIASLCGTNSGANCQSFATSDINIQDIYQPSTTSGVVALKDNISGTPRMTTEATLGLYNFGDGSGSATAPPNTRPILTTSSSIGSTPYLPGTLPVGTPITGVQGTAGTLVQMSTGAAVSGDFVKFDGSGDAVDSAVSVASPTFSGTTTVSTLTASVINQPAASSFGGTCSTSGAGTCTFSIGHSFTSTPICIVTEQVNSLTVRAANCYIPASSTTVTVNTTGAGLFGAIVIGNPN
jgi:hypothetical protein